MQKSETHLAIDSRFENVSRSRTFKNIIELFDLGQKAVLDIGCSYGEFLAHFGEGSIGISINKEEVAYGSKRGLDIRYGNIESKDFDLQERFDVIFANNIFEHLYSPHEFLHKVREFLKPGGILILGVPCIPKLVFLLYFRKFRGSLANAHINFFTRDTLAKTVEKGGWHLSMIRGFRFKSVWIDRLLVAVYPHFYAVGSTNPDFAYSTKRTKELAGYQESAHD
jgi:SAM-dependent methyltransferase